MNSNLSTTVDTSYWRPPVVAARVTGRSWDGVWQLEIDCPYCSTIHRHGGGGENEPEASGRRAQHCKDIFFRRSKTYDATAARRMPQYELAPEDADIDWAGERELASAMLEEVEMALEAATEPGKEVVALEQVVDLLMSKPPVSAKPTNREAKNAAAARAFLAMEGKA